MAENKNNKSAVKSGEKNKKTIIIISVALLAAVILGIVLGVVIATRDNSVDLLKDDLSEYITLAESDYKNYPVSAILKEYSEADLLAKINKLIVKNKAEKAEYDGLGTRKIAITIGDELSIYYRGYTVDETGLQTAFDGSSNFNSSAATLEIGSGSFIPGFEEALIGKVPDDYEKFFKISSGKVSEDYVIYISYQSYSENSNKNVSYERLDLSRTDIDKEYGEGFREFILSSEIGVALDSKTFTKDGKSIGYQALEIKFATECEDNCITIDVTFPGDYNVASLRGVDAKYDVFIDYAVIYNTEEFDEKFITKTLGVKESELSSYEGANIVEKYKNLLREEAKAEIKKSNDTLILEDMWTHYKKKVKVISLPESEVNKYYDSYYSEVVSTYNSNTSSYSSLDDCAIKYLKLSTGADWRTYLKKQAEDVTLEKIIFYYVIREEGFVPTEAEYKEIYNEVYEDHVDYYISLHEDELSKLEGDAYNAYVEDLKAEVIDYYGEIYFDETVYYRYGSERLVGLASLTPADK